MNLNINSKLIFSIYIHQLDKTEKLLLKLKDELNLLTELIKKEETIFSGMKGIVKLDKKRIDDFNKKKDNIITEIDEEIKKGTYLFIAHYDIVGLSATKEILEKNFLTKYENLYNALDKEKTDKAKEIIKKKFICDLFDFKNQHTKVFKDLKDNRTWEKKAEAIGMSEDYKIMYDYTSALIHSTSYSLLTPDQIDDEEISFNLIFLKQYIEKIIKNIEPFLEEKIKIVETNSL